MPMSILRRAISYYRSQGLFALAHITYQKFLRHLLFREARNHNGIKWPSYALSPEIYFESWIPRYSAETAGDMQWGEIYAHRNYTEAGDHVVIIGGGAGISAAAAANEVGPEGQVSVYEPSERHADIIKKTASLNSVADRITVHRRSVGPKLNIAGSTKKKV
jgi:hypothetical protein